METTRPQPVYSAAPPVSQLNPALARFAVGCTMVYGNLGDDSQPQSQSAVLTYILTYVWNSQTAIGASCWLLDRTWGEAGDSFKLESFFAATNVDTLRQRGHEGDLRRHTTKP